ncbi:zinc finger protein 341-like [Cimex lectularius]|uniref:C2H2-type domain-containing protein n=1 Tax=Cimex lectularius TaxID=79782 RepID=A0A8I6SAG0_CIMLE|nr:zinc finger protein 341-like [Cimex lectularius]
MAQIFYTALPVVGGDQQQAELDFHNLFQPMISLNSDVQDNSIILDEGDVFQCGKCRNKFSFSDFVLHKKSNCQGNLVLTNSEEYNIDEVRELNEEIESPIILDGSNLITLMQDNENDSANLCQNYLDIQNEINETSINLECKSYRIVNDIPNIEVNNFLQDSYSLRDDKVNQCILQDNGEIDYFSGSFTRKDKCDVNDTKVFETLVKQKGNRNVENKTDNVLKCSFCDKVFRKNFNLQQHIRSHTGERPFLCVICGKAFTQKSNVIKHMGTHKVWPKKICNLPKFHVHVNSTETSVTAYQVAGDKTFIAFDKTFFCQYCPSAFSNYSDWRLHMKSHVNVKVYKCIQNACDSTFSDLDQFLEHTQTHWGMAQYTCHICQLEFHSLDELGLHQTSHTLETKKAAKSFSCRKCGSKFTKESTFSEHKCNVYSCPLCNRTFHSVRFLRRHLALHSATPSYPCPDCDKAFKTPKYLSAHRLIHSSEKPYNCQICSAAFNRRDKLVRHSLTHTNEKQFKCPFFNKGCTKEYNRKDKLKQHITHTHNSNKPVFQQSAEHPKI